MHYHVQHYQLPALPCSALDLFHDTVLMGFTTCTNPVASATIRRTDIMQMYTSAVLQKRVSLYEQSVFVSRQIQVSLPESPASLDIFFQSAGSGQRCGVIFWLLFSTVFLNQKPSHDLLPQPPLSSRRTRNKKMFLHLPRSPLWVSSPPRQPRKPLSSSDVQ